MRRNIRKVSKKSEDLNVKIIKYSAIGVSVLAIIVLALLLYSRKLNEEVKEGTLTGEQIANILNSSIDTESASSEIGKTVDESKNEMNNLEKNQKNVDEGQKNNLLNIDANGKLNNQNNSSDNNVNKVNSELNTKKVTEKELKSENQNESNVSKKDSDKKEVELKFEKPVEGDIVKEFSVENLVYSNTLEEWTTHTGIDIKADKTTVVKSAESGVVKKIKNDPRYGVTIVVEHANGFQTIYSNLLTAEFVVEGEKVEKGQSLGTVGNTAAFEIADEPHLHFELWKEGVSVDPNIYLK